MGNTFRENTVLTIKASGASTEFKSMLFTNPGYTGGVFTFNVTAGGSTTSLPTFTVQGRAGDSTRFWNVGQVVSTSTNSVVTLFIHPGLSTTAIRPAGAGGTTGKAVFVKTQLPTQFRVHSTNSGGAAATVTWAGWVELQN